MRFDILTLFPDFFPPFLEEGVLGRAVKKGILNVRLTDIRSFADGRHKVTDDRPYGGGNGMVMKPGPIYQALKSIERTGDDVITILLTPQGRKFNQAVAWDLAEKSHIILICGRYEGVDERIISGHVDLELSIGDYVLSGGETAAMVVVDAVGRLVPGVLGGEKSNTEDSFEDGLLEHPHFTRPRNFMGQDVPEILLSGDHERIRIWRRKESLKRTLEKRPDLLKDRDLGEEDRRLLKEIEKLAEKG
ncbi:MAG: tRNA (guanosine(37)-N1)-methyltransferase TrmD [Deltaproteobacteria bacterium]|nr:tRNA (guanosine(37)-N1)-methyltransferase TrmD [Deltaproteobacteria bacterium]